MFPDTTYPDTMDVAQSRADGVDIVWDDDFNYHDKQIRKLQDFIGLSGELLGQRIAGKGLGGMVSPVASGGQAFKLAARQSFVAGDLLSVGDAYDTVYTEKLRLDYTGLLWALAGIDATPMLKIPRAALPAPGSPGRLQWNTGSPGLYYDDGLNWLSVGSPSAGSYADMAVAYEYTSPGAAVEEVIGEGIFDGSLIVGSLQAYFRAIVSVVISGARSSQVKLYDMGPKAGPAEPPVLITTLSTAVGGGPQALEQLLSVGVAPGVNQIANSARMYELTAVQTVGPIGDTIYVGSAGLDVR